MGEAYLIDVIQGQVAAGKPRSALVGEVFKELFGRTGIPARRLQEIHWLESSANLLEPGLLSAARELGLSPDLAAFQWPSVPLLAHHVLQSVVRAAELGERDLVLICQFGHQGRLDQDCLVALLIASPAAVGRYNLAPRGRFGRRASLNLRSNGLPALFRKLLEPEPVEEPQSGPAEEQEPIAPRWLAAARVIPTLPVKESFPHAQWLEAAPSQPTGGLFLLARLLEKLEAEGADWGLLLGEGPQAVGLATLLQRM